MLKPLPPAYKFADLRLGILVSYAGVRSYSLQFASARPHWDEGRSSFSFALAVAVSSELQVQIQAQRIQMLHRVGSAYVGALLPQFLGSVFHLACLRNGASSCGR